MLENLESQYSLIRVFDTQKEKIIDHILSLDSDDRYMRFTGKLSDSIIAKYVERSLSTQNTRTNSDFWYAIIDENKKAVATIHIAIRKDTAEFALTTSKEHRGKKLGQILFARGYQLVSEFSIDQIYLTCLSKNAPMQKIAQKFGLEMTYSGTEIDALTKIPSPMPLQQLETIRGILSEGYTMSMNKPVEKERSWKNLFRNKSPKV